MNVNETLYFWIEGEVVTMRPAHMVHNDVPCIDTRFGVDELAQRVGMFLSFGWQHIPIEELPEEFRLQLLIMGVPT